MESKRMFDRFVSVGNVKAAIRLVTEQNSGQCLPLNSIQADGSQRTSVRQTPSKNSCLSHYNQ